ncbi:ArnT family glycosyltransferase [Ancylobacter lacus]|uniref:ArnT family glycosyltransferase n=1 Tax=Ancylobacter lacus TaxID=2579970 RepID=UPI001BD1AB35|nr:glycosyltransferase family 39 protein [Ancylobacter lacus]MBS7537805.1 glycosyltransferase family 39 protein [Ancylobacter lacus]
MADTTGSMAGAEAAAPRRWLAALAANAVVARVLLVALCLAVMVPGLFHLPAVDRDEARFAQATRQMLASGDYVTPRLGAEPRFKKPIGIYWLQSAAAHLTGHGDGAAPIWVLRLPSLIAAILAVLMTHAIGVRLFGPRAALLGAALLATCLVLNGEARLAKTDATQLAAAVAGQLALLLCYLAPAEAPRRLGPALLFWCAMGAGILLKGPIVPMLAALTILALLIVDRRAGWLARLRPKVGVPVLALIVLPWVIAIALSSGLDFFHEAVGNDLLGKVAAGQESHGAPPGAHLAAFFIAFWPGAALAAAAVPWVWEHRRQREVRFLLAWILPFWIVFELIATKLPHYTLPAYPAIALLAGAAAYSPRLDPAPRWARWLVVAAAAGAVASAFALPAALVVLQQQWVPLSFALALAGLVAGVMAGRRALAGALPTAYRWLFAAAVALYGLGFGVVAPRLDMVWLSPRLAAAVAAHAPCTAPQLFVAGYSEASALFYLGKDTGLGDGAAAADFLAGPGCRVAIVSDRQKAAFDARQAARGGPAPRLLDTVTGLNTGNGRLLTMSLLGAGSP